MSSQLDRVLNAYRTLALIPALASAKIYKNGSTIISNWTERNLERNKTSKIEFTHNINKDLEVTSETSFGIDITNELISIISPSENLKALIRESTDSKDAKKQYLEIWRRRQIKQCIDLAALDIHGDVYTDSEFGSFNWNNTEDRLIYIAERKLPKSEPFFKRNKSNSKEGNDDPTPLKGIEYDYKPEWGEQLVGKHLSSIIMCQLETEAFDVIDWIPDSWCPGQVSWSPNGEAIIGVAWETEPRRLGLIFCTNRPSFIFSVTLDKKYVVVSPKGKSVRSPRFSSDGKYLIWLQRDDAGPHHGCHQLVKTSWPLTEEPSIEVVIDIVDKEISITNNETFTGIYAQGFPKRTFADDGKRIVFSTPQRTENRSYVVNLDTRQIVDISDVSTPCSTVVLDVYQDIILAARSSLTTPAQLVIGKLPSVGNEKAIKWTVIDDNSALVPEAISSSDVDYMELIHENVSDVINDFSVLYFGNSKSSSEKAPFIIYPHGGPHSSFVNSFSMDTALLRMLGFSVVLVNFRGSTGAGQSRLLYLPGRIGEADVKDCILAADKALEKYNVDADNCSLFGGSHGGFLVTHLSGQYPDRFKSVVARNPVIDVATMINSSDIPDWCAFEAGSEFTEVGPVDNNLLRTMRMSSPLVHAHNVKVPTLLCLGSKDKRVPYFQGIEYFHRIKANGCKARMLVYEDNHSLSSGTVEMDHLVNAGLWFLEHLK
ncbi:acylamino-acid-releasing enzyme-like isoform X2 [Arctopsyche grandis]|uniref:acylamino-acid-releasing enzyme-like isoform X2 n=1 Tax=Arctopsyche grandis TaxID=121162 RepID=UPI00406D88ED